MTVCLRGGGAFRYAPLLPLGQGLAGLAPAGLAPAGLALGQGLVLGQGLAKRTVHMRRDSPAVAAARRWCPGLAVSGLPLLPVRTHTAPPRRGLVATLELIQGYTVSGDTLTAIESTENTMQHADHIAHSALTTTAQRTVHSKEHAKQAPTKQRANSALPWTPSIHTRQCTRRNTPSTLHATRNATPCTRHTKKRTTQTRVSFPPAQNHPPHPPPVPFASVR
jgi:hypothetical protein